MCCPLTEATRGMIGKAELAAMPRGGYVVNVARGPVVDGSALFAALRDNHLAGAGLDVARAEPIDPDDGIHRERRHHSAHRRRYPRVLCLDRRRLCLQCRTPVQFAAVVNCADCGSAACRYVSVRYHEGPVHKARAFPYRNDVAVSRFSR